MVEEAKKIDIKKQEAELARRQKQQVLHAKIDALLHLYQDAGVVVKDAFGTLAVDVRNDVIKELSYMVNIIERDDWYTVHVHDTFPDVDLRMLSCSCPVDIECPFLRAVLRKIKMQKCDYVNYRKRAGNMIAMEHGRKMGKHR